MTGTTEPFPAPLFILCTGRAFSSVVSSMIGQHPEMSGLPEMNFFMYKTLEEHVDKIYSGKQFYNLHGLTRALAQMHEGSQTEESIDQALHWLKERLSWSGKDVARYMASALNPLRMVEKSPSNCRDVQCLERLRACFPEARFLHLTRHPRGVCNSLYTVYNPETGKRKRKFSRIRPEAITQMLEDHYIATNERIIGFLETVPSEHWLRLQGEQLLQHPEAYLKQIAAWLEIDPSPQAIAAMKAPENSVYAAPGPTNAPGGHNPGFLQGPALRPFQNTPLSLAGPLDWDLEKRFSQKIKRLARELGYQ